jgi:hypothetical protein
MTKSDRPGAVERATRSELLALGVSVQRSSMAALAVAMARQVDQARGGVSAAAAATRVEAAMDAVRKELSTKPSEDRVDDLRARRAARRGTA